MNRRVLSVIAIVIVLIGGFFYFKDRNQLKEQLPNEDITNVENDEELLKQSKKIQETYDIEIGKEAPNFTLKNLSGREISLKDYREKIVVLNFWATTCVYCREQMPDIQKLDKENEDVVVLSVNVMEDKKTVENYIKKNGYDFEVVLDEKGDLARDYLVSGFPTSHFIDKEGVFLGGVPAKLEYEQMLEIINDIRQR